jgi:hypothetical protein
VDSPSFNFSEQECHGIASEFREKLKTKICSSFISVMSEDISMNIFNKDN